MATYNGAKYVEEQIKSIQAQTISDWSLLIRDDGSQDDTLDRVLCYSQNDNRISVLQDELGNLGVSENFACLMQVALNNGADYVAFSDQDDIWHPNKLQILLDKITEIESGSKANLPTLVHSDLEVVDEAMCTINSSFMGYAGISPANPRLEHLLCQNIVTGCACLINRALLKLALPIPKGVPIHDWWIALLALSCGKIGYVDQPLVRYRQHSQNIVGVKYDLTRAARYMLMPENWRLQIKAVQSGILQSGLLIERLQASGSALRGPNEVVEKYAGLANMKRLMRLKFLTEHKIHKRSVISNCVFQLIVFCLSNRTASETK
jgi:glycosyltransferase involved in cell wall biosynthesis